jgi:16S rRNA (guanine527-N7)-methyltransferase
VKHHITRQSVSRETFESVAALFREHETSLNTYLDQLLWWNERINLVSRNVSRETVVNHIHHSLLLSQLECFQKAEVIVDAGTGGGLPGLPLALTHPEKKFLLNDIISKKVLTLKQMIKKTGVSNTATNDGSVENLEIEHPFLLISKHAFKINDLFQFAKHLPWTHLVFYKGADFEHELNGIETPLKVTCHELYKNSKESFFKDKSIIIISRR